MEQKPLPTTRAEEIAGPYMVKKLGSPEGEYWYAVVGADGRRAMSLAMHEPRADLMAYALNAAYNQGQQDRWISVESKLPEELPDGTNVLGWNSVRMEPVLATLRGGLPFDVWNEGWDHKNEITHWAPLPPNPEQR